MIIIVFLLITQINLEVEMSPRFRNKELTIGDPFEITLTIMHHHNIDITEPFVDSLGSFMILEQTCKIVQEKAVVTNTYNMRVAAFNTGDLEIPVFKVIGTIADSIDTVVSNAIPVTIASTLPEDMTDIHDLKKAVAFPDFLPLIIAGIVLGCAILAFIAYRLVKKWIKIRTAETPRLPPWIEALAAIDTIPVQDWITKGRIKKYYYTLSEVLKRYIERRFDFNAAEQTTTEIVTSMKVQQVPLRNEFGGFFSRADLVKYAKFVPPEDEMFNAVQTAKDLVNKTKLQEPEETQ